MAVGTVKWFNDERGYGFIQPSDGSKDVFVHASAVRNGGTLMVGDRVRFLIEADSRGRPRAMRVEPAKEPR